VTIESDSSNPARCISCVLYPCEQIGFYPNSICANYRTELTYEVKQENKDTDPLVRFTCVKSGVNTEWFDLTSDEDVNLQASQQLQCRPKDIIPQVSKVATELGKIGTQENPIELTHLNDIENPLYAGRHVKVTAVVSSDSFPYLVPAEISADVTVKDDEYGKIRIVTDKCKETITPTDPVNLSLIDIPIETKERRLKRLFNGCKITNLKTLKQRTAYFLRVRPPVHTIQQQNDKLFDEHGREYKHYDIYVITDKPSEFQSSTKIILTGIPSPNPKTQRITLLTYKVENNETTDNFDVKKLTQITDKLTKLPTVQERLDWLLENTRKYTHIIGRSSVATAVYLSYFTPISLSLNNDDRQRGWGLVDIIGDSTTGKSETVKKIARLLNAGMVISAETASIAGIIGTTSQMDNRAWFVDWGYLPLMDGKLLAMDGCHKLPSWEWAKTAETERDGILNIAKAGKATTSARTRQIKIYNAIDKETSGYPTKQLSEFLHPIQAYPSVADPTIIARRDLAIFVNSRDVTAEQVHQINTAQPDPEYLLLSEALKWCWSGKTEIFYTEEALMCIQDKATELYNTFHYAPIPIVSIDMPFKLARLSIALAHLTLSTSDDYKTVVVTKEHVEVVGNFLTEEYTKSGLNILAQTSKFETLTIDDVNGFFIEIEFRLQKDPVERDNLCRILQALTVNGRITKDILRTTFGLTDNNQQRPLLATLQSLGLTKHGNGIFSTPKLVEAYKVANGFEALKNFNTVNTFTTVEKGASYTQNTEKQNLTAYYTEVTEVNTDEKPVKTTVFPYKTELTEVTEQTEYKTERGTQVYPKEEVSSYRGSLVCYICQRPLMENDWGEYPTGIAHNSCYAERQRLLIEGYQHGADEDLSTSKVFEPIDHETFDFEDKCEPSEGDL
jgi:hypothetical protein